MQLKQYSKFIFLLLFALLLYVSFKVVEPYLISIVTAFILAILFNPVYKWLLRKTKRKVLSGLLVIISIMLIVALPLAFILQALIFETNDVIDLIRSEFSEDEVLELNCEDRDNLFCDAYSQIGILAPNLDLKEAAISSGKYLLGILKNALSALSSGLLQFVISLYILFFILVDGKKLMTFVKKSLALKPSYEKYISKTIGETINGVVFGNIMSSLIQGAIAGLGYWLIGGFNSAILLALFTAFFALIPTIGTAIVWVPAGLYLLLQGWVLGTGGPVIRGIILLAYGALIVSTIDNVLKPKLIGDRAKIHPAVVLIGVLGGLKFMGIMGVMVGPLILAMFINFIKLLRIERKNL